MMPGTDTPTKITRTYERDHAQKVVLAAMSDYAEAFPRRD
jgi:hypothetical protein